MRVHYRYEPDMCRFWIGATDGEHYHEFALQHWMDVNEVIHALEEMVNRVSATDTDTH